jgi:lysozyme
MECSQSGLDLIKSFESCRLEAYLDSRGIPTLGFGHTFGVRLGLQCTQEQADAWLLEDVQSAVDSVNRLVKVPLTQGQMDALVSFVYNCGSGNFAGSTLLKLLNSGDYDGCAGQFTRWDLSGGNVVAGLLRRREAEREEFNGPGI